MVTSLNAENALFFRQFKSHQFSMCGIHLNSFVDADCIAREIVDILFAADQDHKIRSNDEVLECLSARSRSYLFALFSKNFQKKSTSLIRFIEFYPSLFSKNEYGQLQLVMLQILRDLMMDTNSYFSKLPIEIIEYIVQLYTTSV